MNESNLICDDVRFLLDVCGRARHKPKHGVQKATEIQGDTKKQELLKYVVAATYSWQHCGTGTLSYRQPRHFSNHGSDLKRQVIMVQFLSINIFFLFLQFLLGFSKVLVFCVSLYLCQLNRHKSFH